MSQMRQHLVRYTGLVGAILLAVAAFLGGALPTLAVGVTPVTIASGEHGVLILLCWLAGTGAMVWAWWSARHGVPSVRWAMVTIALWWVPLLVAPPLGSRDVYSYACQGAVHLAGADPYAGVADGGCPWLDSVAPLWRDTAAPYGPVFVLLAGAAVALGGSLVGTIVVLRLLALVGVVLTAACLPGLARHCGVPAGRAVWLALACPVVGVHLVSGAHNDALMVGLLVAGLRVIATRPDRVATALGGGALLGSAASIKVTALVVVPFAALVGIGGSYRLPALLRNGGLVIGGVSVVLGGATVASGLGWGWTAGLARSGDSLQWTSPPTALGNVIEYLGRPLGWRVEAIPVARALALVLLAGFLLRLWWWAWRGSGPLSGWRGELGVTPGSRPDHRGPAVSGAGPAAREPTALFGAGLALAATVGLAPVVYPWYVTWPLAVLAATAHRTRWFLVPVVVACFIVLPDGTGLAPFTKGPGTVVMTGLIVVLAARLLGRRRGRSAR